MPIFKPKTRLPKLTCPVCRRRWRPKSVLARYCSDRCRLDASILRRSAVLEKHGIKTASE